MYKRPLRVMNDCEIIYLVVKLFWFLNQTVGSVADSML